MTKDHVFCLRGHKDVIEWYAMVNGRVVGATWPDKGSALAGMQTEQRRNGKRDADRFERLAMSVSREGDA